MISFSKNCIIFSLETISKDSECLSKIQPGKSSTGTTKKTIELKKPRSFPKNKNQQNKKPLQKKHKTEKKPDDKVRYDRTDHFPRVDNHLNATRCKNCSGKSHVWCIKCGVHLCLLSYRNCFEHFHTKSS